MREILFRGKRIDNGELVEGHYHCTDYIWNDEEIRRHYILPQNYGDAFVVDPKTIGQFTGLIDKNGKKIFEGDIVTAKDEIWGSPFCYGITGKIVYDEASFFIEPKDVMETQYLFNECAVYEIIGNIHDTPELLGGMGYGV